MKRGTSFSPSYRYCDCWLRSPRAPAYIWKKGSNARLTGADWLRMMVADCLTVSPQDSATEVPGDGSGGGNETNDETSATNSPS